MNYNFVSSKEVIARLDNSFAIDNANWLPSAPLWIADAMELMELVVQFEDVKTEVPLIVTDYHVAIPNDISNDVKRIKAVKYDNLYLRNTATNQIPHIYNRLSLKFHPIESFCIKNNYIITSFQSGEIDLYYTRPMIEYDQDNMTYYPFVPNNIKVFEAIQYYLIFCILRKGGRHDVYKLDTNNPVINPYLLFEKYRKQAKNSIGALDSDDRKELSRMFRQFIMNYDFNVSNDFEPNKSTATPLIANAIPNSWDYNHQG